MAIHGKSQEYMAIHVNTWQFPAIHVNTWQFTSIHGKSQQHMAIHGDTWQFTAIHDHTMYIPSRRSPDRQYNVGTSLITVTPSSIVQCVESKLTVPACIVMNTDIIFCQKFEPFHLMHLH